MKALPVFCTILAAFREYLYTTGAFAEVNVYLAVLPVNFVLDAHPSTALIKTVLDAASLDPVLSADLGPRLRLHLGEEFRLS